MVHNTMTTSVNSHHGAVCCHVDTMKTTIKFEAVTSRCGDDMYYSIVYTTCYSLMISKSGYIYIYFYITQPSLSRVRAIIPNSKKK